MVRPDTVQAHAPFAASLVPSFFFRGAARGELLDSLFAAVDEGAPVCLITGRSGGGKSALVSELDGLFEHVAQVLYLPHPQMPSLELFRVLAEQCGVETGALDRDDAIEAAVQSCLLNRRAQGRRTVLVVEEAQAATSGTLRSLHRLCHSGGDDPWLQLLVFADRDAPESAHLPRLLTPVSEHFELADPTEDDVLEYCNAHLRSAAKAPMDADCAQILHATGDGSFRRINALAKAALERAESERAEEMSADHVRQALRELGLPESARVGVWSRMRRRAAALPKLVELTQGVPRRVGLAVSAAVAVGVITALLLPSTSDHTASTESAPVDEAVASALQNTVTEPRVLGEQDIFRPQAESTLPVEPPAIDVAQAELEPEITDPATETRRSLGDPRLAFLGGAIAKLATQVSGAGDGPFALRSTDRFDGAFALVKRVDSNALQLGTVEQLTPVVLQPAQTEFANPAESIDGWFDRSSAWLSTGGEGHYSIQLLLVSRDTDKLKDFIDGLPADVDLGSMHAFPTERDGRALTLVVFGDYPDANAARQAIDSLPRSLRRLQPFVRSVESLRGVAAI
ncbi:MAG: AAA family ATPase [Pseudomonadota bacterium]